MVLGSAKDSIAQLAAHGVRFDLAFLDADKGGYLGYYRQVCCQAWGQVQSCIMGRMVSKSVWLSCMRTGAATWAINAR